jgi:ABC-type antimicrobial peptide transport system permease subunit
VEKNIAFGLNMKKCPKNGVKAKIDAIGEIMGISHLLKRSPATFEIVLYCAPIIVLVGIWAGVNSAVQRDKPFDHATRIISILGTSMPSFFFGVPA